jgi:UDP-N-acetylglucosamine enolpyruvyl transferase
MSLTATPTVDATADVSLRVPRGESEDLEAGAAEVLASLAAVEAVTIDRVTGVDPTWTDIHVDAAVELTARVESEEPVAALETELEDGFGVVAVNGLAIPDDV